MALFRRKPQQMSLPGMNAPRGRRRQGRRPGSAERLEAPPKEPDDRADDKTTVPRGNPRLGDCRDRHGARDPSLWPPGSRPRFRKQTEGWSPIGKLTDPGPDQPDLSPIGTPIEAHFTQFVQDAYLQAQPQQVAVYVINEGDGKFTIYDDHCTHLGCPFSWNADEKQFDCPCHNGVFDSQGRVLGGPSPRPLDHYEFKVENGVLYAGKLFKVNDQLQRITQ